MDRPDTKKQLKGFTLPEVIVAMAVLVMVIFSATNLVVSIIRSNTENIRTLTAYGLAQEGIEAVRNMRDSNWLLGARFNGTLGSLAYPVWNETLPDDSDYYIVRLNSLERSPTPITNVSQMTQLAASAPWKLERITGPEDTRTTLRAVELENSGGQVQYVHADILSESGEETAYHRYLFIENKSEGATVEKLRATSVVFWKEFGRDKEVRLVTELTDWNKGQL